MKNFLFTLILLVPILLVGQTKHDVGLFLGYSNSGTDVHSWAKDGEGLFSDAYVAYGANYTYNFNSSLGLRLNYTGTKIQGDDKNLVDLAGHVERGYSFESNLHEGAILLQYDLLGKRRFKDGGFSRTLSPYILAGVAMSFTNPDVKWNGEGPIPHNPNDDVDVKKSYIQIPVGLGVKYDVSQKLYIAVEARSIIPTNDYIDGISLSANPDQNDSYLFAGINVGMRLGIDDRDKDGVADDVDNCPDVAGLATLGGCPDADGDGITDASDDCPMVAGVEALNGCPDSDGDGIADKNDDCPNIAGEGKYNGCVDSDGDGVRDLDDKCPSEAGSIAYAGCVPPDADGDGVEDMKDMCPNVAGTLEGCPDSDEDGFADKDDKCPEVKGMLAGCPDTDKDGVADASDKCPKVKGDINNNGCPKVNAIYSPVPNWAKDLYFNTASSGLNKKARLDIKEILSIAKQYPDAKFMISGYTDSRGDSDMNQKLSEKRAKGVYDILIKRGVSATKLRYAGYGEQNPKVANDTKGSEENRRVEVRFSR